MKTTLTASLLTALLSCASAATAASADNATFILGKWVCYQQRDDVMIVTQQNFRKNGKMTAKISFEGEMKDIPVKATMKYRSAYQVKGDQIFDQAEDAQLTAFQVGGRNARGTPAAISFRATMLAPDVSVAKIRRKDGGYMDLQSADGTLICRRPNQPWPES